MLTTRRIATLLGLWLSFHALLAQAGASPFATASQIADILGSAAGRIIARELGLSPRTRQLLTAGETNLADAEAQELAQSLSEIRTRYLEERPQDRLVFESAAEADEPLFLKSKQEKLIRQLVKANPSLRTYRAESAAFLAGEAAAPAELPPIPTHIPMDINKARAEQLFAAASDGFVSNLDSAKLKQVLQALKEQGLAGLTSEAKLELKARRKDAARLCNAFTDLDTSHDAPAAIKAFARDFGKLNDAIENDLDELSQQRANELIESFDSSKLLRALDQFTPTNRSSFNKYFSKLTASIRANAEASTLPIEKFHELRKDLKEIMNLLYFSELLTPMAEQKEAYQFLFDLNTELGLMHDELVGGSLRGEIKYKKQKLEVPKSYREAIKTFLSRLQ